MSPVAITVVRRSNVPGVTLILRVLTFCDLILSDLVIMRPKEPDKGC